MALGRTEWNVFIFGSGPSFIPDGFIPAPNGNFEDVRVSNQTKVRLADGSNAFTTPETVSDKEPIRFVWEALTITERDKFYGYVENSDFLKIVDHLDQIYFGKFIRVRPVWITGEVDSYDIEILFENMPDPL